MLWVEIENYIKSDVDHSWAKGKSANRKEEFSLDGKTIVSFSAAAQIFADACLMHNKLQLS